MLLKIIALEKFDRHKKSKKSLKRDTKDVLGLLHCTQTQGVYTV